eukprot:353893-Chlamydomonas_euryale.AAC.11
MPGRAAHAASPREADSQFRISKPGLLGRPRLRRETRWPAPCMRYEMTSGPGPLQRKATLRGRSNSGGGGGGGGGSGGGGVREGARSGDASCVGRRLQAGGALGGAAASRRETQGKQP